MTSFQADKQSFLTSINFLIYQNHQSGNVDINNFLTEHAENLYLYQQILKKLDESQKISPPLLLSQNKILVKEFIF